MNFWKIMVWALVLVTILLCWCYFRNPSMKKSMSNNTKAVSVIEKEDNVVSEDDMLYEQIARMSLDEKIGQMLIVGFENNYVDAHIIDMIENYHIGGINLLRRNIKDRKQLTEMATKLQDISKTPLFLAVDQEGGELVRINFLKELTSQLKIKNMEQARKIATGRAIELKGLGLNMNFSPVVDYVSDKKSYLYKRTFGVGAEKAGVLGQAMVEGYFDGMVIPVVKHFPGYGNVVINPHTKKAVLDIDNNQLQQHLKPFKTIIEKNPKVPIMTAHILIPLFDTVPATISTKFLTGLLRTELGFEGVIITDDIEMVSAGKLPEEMSVEAIVAGADVVISTLSTNKQILIFNRIKKAVEDGEISEKRLDESVFRILELKKRI